MSQETPTYFIDRLSIEAKDLAEKLTKLNTFINSDSFDEVQSRQAELLIKQSIHMQAYLEVLHKRLAIL
jgi:hypothetical protein